MKTFLCLIGTCFISTGAYFASLNGHDLMIGVIVAFGVWAWFLWGCDRRMKKAADRREAYRRDHRTTTW